LNFRGILKRASRLVIDLLFPRGVCRLCAKRIKYGAIPEICLSCFKKRRTVAGPVCQFCGRELPAQAEVGICGQCLIEKPSYEKHVSQYHYTGTIREIVLMYKVGMRYPIAKIIGGSVARGVKRNFTEERFDLVTFIPSPFKRKLLRRFSPAELIAKTVSRKLHVPIKNLLSFKKHTRPQKGLTAAERKENVKGAFLCPHDLPAGSKVLLIDDIFTTGSTIEEASGALAKKGAKIYAATFAMRAKREFSSEKELIRDEDN
jgi:competence protein ComFC